MKVLLLSYYFPPLGLGGTQRMAKFAKYLPEFGWQPTVVTVKDIYYWARDESLLDDLHDIRIIRTESLDPQRLLFRLKKKTTTPSDKVDGSGGRPSALMQFINQKLLAFFCVPDSKVLWNPLAWREIKRLLGRESFDAVISSGPPFSTHLLAARVSKKYGLKWVADFRDDWAGGHVVHEPTSLHRWLNHTYQQRVVRQADAIIAVSPGIGDDLVRNTPDAGYHLITNGYDPDDYPVPSARDGYFYIVYCGVISKFSEPEVLFKALQMLQHQRPDIYARLRVTFVGQDVTGKLVEYADQYGVGECIALTGFMPHDRALQYVVDADALLLIATGTPKDTFIPGKTFEYLGARKPVLCISNVADTSAMLRQYSAARIVEPNDPKGVYRALTDMVQSPVGPNENDHDFIEQFNRKQQTRKLGKILNE